MGKKIVFGTRPERCNCVRVRVSCFAVLVLSLIARTAPADWPTFRHDASRSGITSDTVPMPLSEHWCFQSRFAPQPAWGDPKPVPIEDILELRRAHFDDVFQVIGGGGSLYFGSSADHRLCCLDLESGAVRWTKTTGGPIRLAPTLFEDRLYFASDDGFAYCINAKDGGDVWRFRAAPELRRALGHGKMISLWPSRTGVLIDGGVAYFGAGVFPAEGVFLYAVDAVTGKLVWCNDSTGENPQSRVSPQGYLVASPSTLYAPMGRVSPAAFRRDNGQLLYETSFGKQVGGCYALVAGEHVYTGTEELVAFDQRTRDRFAVFPGRRLVVAEKRFFLATGTHLISLDREKRSELWKTPSPCADELVLADKVLIAGGENRVMALSADDGKVLWDVPVEGAAKGLSVVDGRLVVSTNKGRIYCFGVAGAASKGAVVETTDASVFEKSPHRSIYSEAAESILRRTNARSGYCLVLGCETGQLAWELAQRTQLTIYCVSADENSCQSARRSLDAAGVYGGRVCVDFVAAGDKIPYSDYFANLVVCESTVRDGKLPPHIDDVQRMIKPQGGTFVIGQPVTDADRAIPDETTSAWRAASAPLEGELVRDAGSWLVAVRGALAGGGSWTHQYSTPENTACGDDQLVKCPLGVLWFGGPGPAEMLNRHVRAASPVSRDGRMFVLGEDVVMAYDIYNGVRLWDRAIKGSSRPNASHDSSSFAVGADGLYVGAGRTCLKLDVATGETRQQFEMPAIQEGSSSRWGWLATEDNRLFGSRAGAPGVSDAVFAFDTQSNQLLWKYESPGIAHNSISLSNGRMFMVSSSVTDAERRAVLDSARDRIAKLPDSDRKTAEDNLIKLDVRAIVALDLPTGRIAWRQVIDMADCGPNVASICHDGVLVLFGVYLDGHYWKEFFAGRFDSRKVIAMSAQDGQPIWDKHLGYRVRPVVVGNTLHAEPWAVDLHTAQSRMRVNPVTGVDEPWQFARPGHHCGCPSASVNCLFFRSWNLGYYDLLGDYGTMHFGAQRPGCWINFMATGGVVVMPEASTGCMCDFPNMGTVVFQPVEQQKAWAWYSVSGPTTPVKQLCMNLGSPGDRLDPSGRIWLGIPRPAGSLVLSKPAEPTFYPGGSFTRANSQYTNVAGSDTPWLFTSAARGLKKLTVPLLEPGDGRAQYRVRLGFLDPEHAEPGQRVFDIQLQGKPVAAGFDIAKAAGGIRQVTWREFRNVEVQDKLTLDLIPQSNSTNLAALPLIQAVEVEREAFLGPGGVVPSIMLNDDKPKQTGEIRLVNLCAQQFRGRLVLEPQPGFELQPREIAVEIGSDDRRSYPVTASVAPNVKPGRYDVDVKLLRADDSVEFALKMPLEHLASLTRTVIKASEDAHVTQQYVDRNFGAGGTMFVDGGDQKMGDGLLCIAYMKFPVAVPGKPVGAKLRIANAGNPTGDAGRLFLADGAWTESRIAYGTRPKQGRELAKIGSVTERQIVEVPLPIDIIANGELTLMIEPTSTDGVDFLTREGGFAAELVVECQK